MFDELARINQLCQHHRYEEAEKILGNLIQNYPNNAFILTFYSEVKLMLEKTEEAEMAINSALSIAPNDAKVFFVKAKIDFQRAQYDDAIASLNNAISINPKDPDFFSLLAFIHFNRKNFDRALNYADKVLELDPEHTQGLNIRSRALLKLNRAEESSQAIEGALNKDPHNAVTHATYGWNLLEKGDHVKALNHFSESLKIDPTLEFAQAGLLEALKSKYWLYRWFLRYAFWMGNLAAKHQWAFIIGFYLVYKLLSYISSNVPMLKPLIVPILIIMALIAFSSWVIKPISNLFLRLNVYGRYLLSDKEIKSANLVGLSALVCLLGILTYFLFGFEKWLVLAGFGLTMMIPLSSIHAPVKNERLLHFYIGGPILVGGIAVFDAFSSDVLLSGYATIYILALFGFQWFVNYAHIKKDNQ